MIVSPAITHVSDRPAVQAARRQPFALLDPASECRTDMVHEPSQRFGRKQTKRIFPVPKDRIRSQLLAGSMQFLSKRFLCGAGELRECAVDLLKAADTIVTDREPGV